MLLYGFPCRLQLPDSGFFPLEGGGECSIARIAYIQAAAVTGATLVSVVASVASATIVRTSEPPPRHKPGMMCCRGVKVCVRRLLLSTVASTLRWEGKGTPLCAQGQPIFGWCSPGGSTRKILFHRLDLPCPPTSPTSVQGTGRDSTWIVHMQVLNPL